MRLYVPLFLAVLLSACAPDASPVDFKLPVSTRVNAAPTAVATPLPIVTPDGVPGAVQSVERALQSSDPAQLAPLLLNEVWVAQEGNEAAGESMATDASLAWLRAHWNKPVVASSNYARDAALLSLSTSGWALRAPVRHGTLILNLHRYDADGSMDDVRGQWKVDTILYQ